MDCPIPHWLCDTEQCQVLTTHFFFRESCPEADPVAPGVDYSDPEQVDTSFPPQTYIDGLRDGPHSNNKNDDGHTFVRDKNHVPE
jgi:hypothetical protein